MKNASIKCDFFQITETELIENKLTGRKSLASVNIKKKRRNAFIRMGTPGSENPDGRPSDQRDKFGQKSKPPAQAAGRWPGWPSALK